MAGSQVSTSVTIIDSLLGFQAISLTNFATSAQSLIAAGSKIEVAGAFFNFASNETPTASSWTAVGTGNVAYITVIPAGTAGSQTITAEYIDTAPIWSDSKQGWYASAASTTRYVGGVIKTSPTQYDDAFIIYGEQGGGADDIRVLDGGVDINATNIDVLETITYTTAGTTVHNGHGLKHDVIDIGDWNMDSTASVTVDISPATFSTLVSLTVIIVSDVNAIGGITFKYDLLTDAGSGTYWRLEDSSPSNLGLSRHTGGLFDSTSFDATSYNRGNIHVWYEP